MTTTTSTTLTTGTRRLDPDDSSRFVSDSATLNGDALRVHGRLEAAGKTIALGLDGRVSDVVRQPRIEAETTADHREQGMPWSALGSMRAPTTLKASGRLVRD